MLTILNNMLLFVTQYLRTCTSSDIETLDVGRVLWEVYAHAMFDWIVSRKSIKIDKFVCSAIIIEYGHGTSGFWNYTEVSHSYFGLRQKR